MKTPWKSIEGQTPVVGEEVRLYDRSVIGGQDCRRILEKKFYTFSALNKLKGVCHLYCEGSGMYATIPLQNYICRVYRPVSFQDKNWKDKKTILKELKGKYVELTLGERSFAPSVYLTDFNFVSGAIDVDLNGQHLEFDMKLITEIHERNLCPF